MRSLVRETHLHPGALILPTLSSVLVKKCASPSAPCPNVFQSFPDEAVKEAEQCAALGIGGHAPVRVFRLKRRRARPAALMGRRRYRPDRTQRVQENRRRPRLGLPMADVCLCEYTSHGHCGVVARDGESYHIENDASVALLAVTASLAGKGGSRYRGPQRHDGWPRRRHARDA